MSFSVQAGDADELLVLLEDNGKAGNLHVLESSGFSVTTVSTSAWVTAGSFLLCRATPPSTRKYAFEDVIAAKVDAQDTVVIDVVDHKKGQLHKIRGKVEQGHLDHARRWTIRLLKLAYKDVVPEKRIRLLINPFSGTGKSRPLWNDKLKPIFDAAGASVDVTFTERIGHAKDIARDLDLDNYDAIACMSGDGIVYEVLNGFALRPDALRAFRMPLGVLPAGSGNALATCILGPQDAAVPTKNVLAILKGRPMPMDLLSVTQGDRQFVSFLSQAYGLMADLDVGTDHLRWMGPSRFVMEYITGSLAQRSYGVELSMRIVEDDKSIIKASCRRTEDATLASNDLDEPFDSDAVLSMPSLRFGTVNEPLEGSKDPGSWTTLTEPVSSIYAGSLPWMAPNLLQFPAARADGLIDVTIQPLVGRLQMLSAVDGAEKGLHITKDYIKYYKCEAYRLTPKGVIGDPKRPKWLAIDGEVMEYSAFQVEAHKGLARVLTPHRDWFLPKEWTNEAK